VPTRRGPLTRHILRRARGGEGKLPRTILLLLRQEDQNRDDNRRARSSCGVSTAASTGGANGQTTFLDRPDVARLPDKLARPGREREIEMTNSKSFSTCKKFPATRIRNINCFLSAFFESSLGRAAAGDFEAATRSSEDDYRERDIHICVQVYVCIYICIYIYIHIYVYL